jgi:hypothetical protein
MVYLAMVTVTGIVTGEIIYTAAISRDFFWAFFLAEKLQHCGIFCPIQHGK